MHRFVSRTRKARLFLLAMLLILTAALSIGCGGGGGASSSQPPVIEPPIDPPIVTTNPYCRLWIAGVQNDMLPLDLLLSRSFIVDYGSYIKICGSNRMAPYNRLFYIMQIAAPYSRSNSLPATASFMTGTGSDLYPFVLGDTWTEFGAPRPLNSEGWMRVTFTQYGNFGNGAYWVGQLTGRVYRPATGEIFDFKLEFSLPPGRPAN